MQTRCRQCNRPYALKREEIYAALDVLYTENLKHYNAICPHCGKVNQLSQKELQRAAPGWTKPEPEETQE